MRTSHRGRRWNIGVILFVVTAAVLLDPGAASAAEGAGGPDERPPNVLFLFSDDQRPDTIAALGNDHIETPNLDRLAERGFTFTRAYCMGSMSAAVCLPSRAMVNSGRSLWRADDRLEDTPTWGEAMRKAGYATFATGKWHNGADALLRGFERGEAVFLGGMSDHFDVPARRITAGGGLERIDARGTHSSELFADAAVEFLESYEDERPFFLYASFTAPHDPVTPPLEYLNRYDADALPLPPNYLPEHPFDNGEMAVRDERLLPHPRAPGHVRRNLAAYYAMITHMDAQVGRILDALDASGRAEDTLIVFAGDHGLAVGSHGLLGKQNLHEHSVGTPLIFAGPGIPRGRSDAFAYLFDIFPTVCDLTGAAFPEDADGRSLAPILSGEQRRVRDSAFFAYRNVQRAVRDDRWKLIRYNVDGERTVQLFDLRSDPHETLDLAQWPDDPVHAEQIERLDHLLDRWREELDDPVDFDEDQRAERGYPGRPMREPTPVEPAADGSLNLAAEQAGTFGTLITYDEENGRITGWVQPHDGIECHLRGIAGGRYRLTATYATATPGQPFTVSVNDQPLRTARTQQTGGLEDELPHDLGAVELPPGDLTLRIQPAGPLAGALMNFRRLDLAQAD